MTHCFRRPSGCQNFRRELHFERTRRAHFDYMMERINIGFGPTTEEVDGEPYGGPHFRALSVSPPLAVQLSKFGYAVMSRQGQPQSFTQHDHEMIDLVLPLDSGYWALLAGHTPCRNRGRDSDRSDKGASGWDGTTAYEDEREVVGFIRSVRDGAVTDNMWSRMMERIGSERGVVEYVYLICLLIFHHRFCWRLAAAEMTRDAFDRMLSEFEDGTRPVPHPYKAPSQANENA